MDHRFDRSPLMETTVDSASDTAVPVAGGRYLRRAFERDEKIRGREWIFLGEWALSPGGVEGVSIVAPRREGKWIGALTVRVSQRAPCGPEGDRWG